eukprot:1475514-Prymnesium_polylepis.1
MLYSSASIAQSKRSASRRLNVCVSCARGTRGNAKGISSTGGSFSSGSAAPAGRSEGQPEGGARWRNGRRRGRC